MTPETLADILGDTTTRRTDKAIKRGMKAMLRKQYLIAQAEIEALELSGSVIEAIRQVRYTLGVSLPVARSIVAK